MVNIVKVVFQPRRHPIAPNNCKPIEYLVGCCEFGIAIDIAEAEFLKEKGESLRKYYNVTAANQRVL